MKDIHFLTRRTFSGFFLQYSNLVVQWKRASDSVIITYIHKEQRGGLAAKMWKVMRAARKIHVQEKKGNHHEAITRQPASRTQNDHEVFEGERLRQQLLA
jgi:hypothetical protein